MTHILYIGDSRSGSTSRHRASALERIGCRVTMADPYEALGHKLRGPLQSRLHFRFGYRLLQRSARAWCEDTLKNHPGADAIWVNGGELFSPACIRVLREAGCPVILYNNDDVTGTRDGRRFDSIREALPLFDLCVVCRRPNVDEYHRTRCSNVMLVRMSYDEIEHAPLDSCTTIPEDFRSEVSFVGTWMRNEGRDRFLLDLIDAGLPVAIRGGRWRKSPFWRRLQPHYRGDGVYGRDYVAAIQGAKISLGFLSSGNRDLHTRRSVEIPYAGGLLCAQRTTEHQDMYREGEEAVFWSDSRECAEQCFRLLRDDALRERIRAGGRARVLSLRVGNEELCRSILERLWSKHSP